MTDLREASPFSFRGPLPPPRFNLTRYCLNEAGAARDKVALEVVAHPAKAGEQWTYEALETAILRAGNALKELGLASGSRVVVRLRNTIHYPLAFFGAIAVGLVPVPLSPDLTEREADFLIADSDSTAIILDDALPVGPLPSSLTVLDVKRFASAIESGRAATYADSAADDPAFLIYTSGTTASPKGVLHAHRCAWGRRPMYQGWYGISPSDRLLHAGSFNWTYTLGTGLMDPWANGATTVIFTGDKSREIWPALIEEKGITIFAAVPGVFRQMLKYGDVSHVKLPSLRHGLAAGEALPEKVAEEWGEVTGKAIYQALGQSEISTYISSCPSRPPKKGTVGVAQPGRSVVTLAEQAGEEPLPAGEAGLLAVHRTDPGLMLGYWRRPEEERDMFRGPWFLGGDAAVIDEEGYVTHLGRHNELMNAGGFRVSPLEVEEQLARHPAVAEVAAAEVTVRDGVSIIAAFVVTKDGSAVDPAALAQFASERLASYKCPREYRFVTSLPRTANGKVKRRTLCL